MRKVKFEIGKYYHIYNRGVDKRQIFLENKDFLRFLEGMIEFNCSEPVESLYRLNQLKRRGIAPKALRFGENRSALGAIIAYCLNPNHYHLLIKQLVKDGISKFMQKLNAGYTQYFNKKYGRSGSLFQGPFKAVEVKSDYRLWHISAYINGNAEIHKIVKEAEKWLWSSYPDYLGQRQGKLAEKAIILKNFKNPQQYQKFVKEVIKEIKQARQGLKNIYLLE